MKKRKRIKRKYKTPDMFLSGLFTSKDPEDKVFISKMVLLEKLFIQYGKDVCVECKEEYTQYYLSLKRKSLECLKNYC
jgi:hypothetical protein